MASPQAETALLAMRRHLQQKKEPALPLAAAPARPPSLGSRFAWRRTWWRPLILGACVLLALTLAVLNWSKNQNQGAVPLVLTGVGMLLVLGAVVGIWRRPPGSAPSLRERWARWRER